MKRIATVFLTLCLLMSVVNVMPVSAAWHDGWGLTQDNGTIIPKGDALEFNCDIPYSAGGYLLAETPITVKNDSVDVEWTMQVDSYSGRESIVVNTGAYRLYLLLRANDVRYMNVNNSSPTIYGSLGYDEITLRCIASGGIASLYLNGRKIAEDLQLQKDSGKTRIGFCSYGGDQNQLTKFRVSNVVVRPYTGSGTTVTASGDPPSLTTPPEHVHYEFTEDEDLSEWRLTGVGNGGWEFDMENGTIGSHNDNYLLQYSAYHRFSFADDFKLSMRMRFLRYGDVTGFKLHWPGGYFDLGMRENFFSAQGEQMSDYFAPGELGNDWHVYRFESYNNMERVRVYVDDVLRMDFESSPSTREYYHFQPYTIGMGDPSSTEIDWVDYQPIWNGGIQLANPLTGGEYLQGNKIPLEAVVDTQTEIPYLEYKLNGVVVATGKAENGYKASVENIGAGNHVLTACYGDLVSNEVNIKVVRPLTSTLKLNPAGNGHVAAEIEAYDKLSQLASVEYLANGISVASSKEKPFAATIPIKSTEGTAISAILKDADGIVLEKLNDFVVPQFVGEQTTTHYSNEVSYTVGGNTGSATVTLANGMHKLTLTHATDQVTYLTDQGEKSISAGLGNYTVLTDGPFADLYYGGKHLVSFLMPQTAEVKNQVTENGLQVSNRALSIPEFRNNYFVGHNVTAQKTVYDLPGVGAYYNLDFLAGKDDNARLVVNDTGYGLDLTMENGVFYVQSCYSNRSTPYRLELAKMVEAEGDVYYRIAMAGGMGILYANGNFLASFRSVKAEGSASLGVDITGGDGLSYLAVNHYSDLYLYQDDFTNQGKSKSIDYWMQFKGASNFIDAARGEMVVTAMGKENAMNEINAFSGNIDMTAEITVKEANGGVWFLLNHAVSETYTKAGYNYKTGKFEISDRLDSDARTTTVTADGNLPVGEKVTMRVTATEHIGGKTVTLYVNGIPVVTKEDSVAHRGKPGFVLSDAVIGVESFSLRTDAKPLLDVRDTPSGYGITLDMIEKEDGSIYLFNTSKGGMTTDGGKTWTQVAANNGTSEHMLRLKNGQIMSYRRQSAGSDARGESTWRHTILISDDDGNTWTQVGALFPEAKPGYGNTIHRLHEGPLLPGKDYGRIFFMGGFDVGSENYGKAQVMYSDDKGATWNTSFEFTYENMGYSSIQEPAIIATESSTRIYYRNEKGMIRYMESPDGGITWDPMDTHSLPFLMALNCFGIDVDPVNGDLWLVWSADNSNTYARTQYPRTNWRVAKSSDDGETWEFLGTLFENNTYKSNQMNLGGNASKEYFIANSYMSDTYGDTNYLGRIGMFPKEKQTTTVRGEQVRLPSLAQWEKMKALSGELLEKTLLIHPESGTAMLRGIRAEGGAAENSVAVEYAASLIGAKVEHNADGTVNLCCGESVAKFATTEKDGKRFVVLDEFVNAYGLSSHQYKGVTIVSTYPEWTQTEMQALRNAVDLFND